MKAAISRFLPLVAAFLFLMPVVVRADFIPLPIFEGEVGRGINANKKSYFDNMGACKAWVSSLVSEPSYWDDCSATYSGTGLCENYRAKEDDFTIGSCSEESFCPDNSTTHRRRNEKDKIVTTCTCLGGYVEKDHACVKPKTCEAGKEIHRDFPVKGPSQLCDGGCMYKLEASVDTGEYGWGGDYVGTGAECSEKPDKPDKPDEPKPDPDPKPDPGPNPGGGGGSGGGGSGGGGSDGGGSDGGGSGGGGSGGGGSGGGGSGGGGSGGGGSGGGSGDGGGSGSGDGGGKPDNPSDGGGSGDGNGKPGGKPGGKPDGKPDGKECGGAGQPPCTVRIDETGTPKGPGEGMGVGGLNSEYDKLDERLKGIGRKEDKDVSWGISPSWLRGKTGCEPLHLGQILTVPLDINYCPAVPFAQGVANFVWIVSTFFAVISLTRDAVGK